MKIKTKKEMNLPELIEWGFKNDIREKSFIVYECVEDQRHEVHFNASGIPKFSAFIKKSNTFTVEVEEKITEDTVFENLIEILDGSPNCLWERASVKDWKDEDSKEFHAYIDGEFKLIWKNGKLVE